MLKKSNNMCCVMEYKPNEKPLCLINYNGHNYPVYRGTKFSCTQTRYPDSNAQFSYHGEFLSLTKPQFPPRPLQDITLHARGIMRPIDEKNDPFNYYDILHETGPEGALFSVKNHGDFYTYNNDTKLWTLHFSGTLHLFEE